jgi:hypothetical protein
VKKQWLEIALALVAVAAGCSSSPPDAVPDGNVDGPTQVDMANHFDGPTQVDMANHFDGPSQVDMSGNDMASGNDMSSGDDTTLLDLELSQGALSTIFTPSQTSYTATETAFVDTLTLTPTAMNPTATITVNGQTVRSGNPSQMIPLLVGMNPITIDVAATTGQTKSYVLMVARSASDYFKASNTGDFDNFGFAVSLSGDTLAVGANAEDSSGTGVDGEQNDDLAMDSGAVYVFVRSGTTWSQQAYLKASNARQNAFFGRAVSLSGDTLAVGATQEDSNATGVTTPPAQGDPSYSGSGAVYIFTRTGETWTQQAFIKASNAQKNDGFGRAVSLSGDTLAVGAAGEDSSATGVGGDQKD